MYPRLAFALLGVLLFAALLFKTRESPIPARADPSQWSPSPQAPGPALPTSLPPTGELSSPWKERREKILARFVAGDYETATALAEESRAFPNPPPVFTRWLEAQYPIILTSAGWTRLRLGDCEAAIPSLTRAHELRPTAESSRGLAFCHHRLGHEILAEEWLGTHLRVNPTDAEILLLQADHWESQGLFDDAMASLEAASAITDLSEKLRAEIARRMKLTRKRAAEAPRQTRLVSPNFTLTCRADADASLGQGILQQLETTLDEFIDDWNLRPPNAPIEVILYPSDRFHALNEAAPAWAGGVFDGRIRLSGDAFPSDNLTRLMRHELAHALLSTMAGGTSLPVWFHEGIAQRLECASARACHADTLKLATSRALLPRARLESSFLGLSAADAKLAYAQSFFLVHTIERKSPDALRELLAEIRPGVRADRLYPFSEGEMP
jgi:tetratricopeptide (TPR) repeat protein